MKRVLFEIAFNGKNYHGWQIQENALTVQEIIEEKCNKSIFTKIKCKTDEYNPVDYLEKRKRCIYIRDTADTVFEGKRRYKNCMKN